MLGRQEVLTHRPHLRLESDNRRLYLQGGAPTRRMSSSSSSGSLLCEKLSGRGLLRLSGADTYTFLQGLITNDMNSFEGGEDTKPCDAMYSMMLNVQGRVLYDLILYQLKEDTQTTYLMECETEVIPELMKLLKRYKIRKKVDIADVSSEYGIWAAFPATAEDTNTPSCKTDAGIVVPDPRIHHLGSRVILSSGTNACTVLENATETEGSYVERRYQLGVGEGLIDLPPGGALPLESNLVFLNGVSFSKGCYIGQELTARSHHTGVIRKRLMPLVLASDAGECTPGDNLENESGKSCGKFRNNSGKFGLGLIRMHDAIGKGVISVVHKDGDEKDSPSSVVAKAETNLPSWWPRDSDQVIGQILSSLEKSQ